MGVPRLQDILVGIVLFTAVTSGIACGHRERDKLARRAAPQAKLDRGTAIQSELAAAALRPSSLTLPEVVTSSASGAHRGGSLRVHLEAEPPHLNPLQDTLQVVDHVVRGLVYETLLECRQDRYLPGLAESWEISSDGLRITLHLRAQVRWQDERPFSGLDVQATFEHLMRAANRSPLLRKEIADLEGVDVLPERTVRLRLVRPSDLTLRALCDIPILPAEHLRGGSTVLGQLGRLPIGTGPFRVAAWDRGKRIKLVRKGGVGVAGVPWLDEIVFEIDTDLSRALLRARRGEIDIMPRVMEGHYPEQVVPAALRDALDLYLLTPHRYSFVTLNTRRGALADSKIRQALSLLWDRGRFAFEIHHGLARPIGAPTFGVAPADRFDKEQADRLLDEAGFKDTDGDGVREVGGAPIRLVFLLPTGARALSTEVRAYALALRRSGILLDSPSVDPATVFGRIERGDFDLAACTWEGSRDEDPRLLLGPQGDYQYTGYRSERFTILMDELRSASSPVARVPLFQQLATLLATDRPALFLYRYDVPALVAKRVHGLAARGDQLDLRSVWLDP